MCAVFVYPCSISMSMLQRPYLSPMAPNTNI